MRVKKGNIKLCGYKILYILGGLSLCYFMVTAAVSSLASLFNYVWLAGGAFFIALGLNWKKRWIVLSRGWKRLIAVVVGVGAVLFMNIEGLILSQYFSKGEPDLDYIIVLGAHMKENGPSTILKMRLDKALSYLKDNPDTIVIVSGGQGSDEPVSEAQGMYDYLVQNGVAGDKIIMEDQSKNTYENLKFSADYINMKENSVGVVTSNFHVYRSVKIAKKQGYENVCGVAAKSHLFLQPTNMLREFFSIIKNSVNGNM